MPEITIDYMREFVSNLYGGEAWKEKVENMPDNQVMGIYFSLQEQERSGVQPRRRNEKPKKNRDRDRGRRGQRYDPYERFTDESDADYYDRINEEM